MENLKNNVVVEDQEVFEMDELELESKVENTSMVNEEQEEELNLSEFVSVTGASKRSSKGRARGGLSIVKASTGQRISLCRDIWEHLDLTHRLQFRVSQDYLLVSPVIDENDMIWNLPDNAEKAILYRAGLVNSLAESYQLDFNDKSSLSFTKYQKKYYQGYPVVLIQMH